MTHDQKKHETLKKKLWCDVFAAIVSSDNCIHVETAVTWADKAVEEYEKRFPKPNVPTPY